MIGEVAGLLGKVVDLFKLDPVRRRDRLLAKRTRVATRLVRSEPGTKKHQRLRAKVEALTTRIDALTQAIEARKPPG